MNRVLEHGKAFSPKPAIMIIVLTIHLGEERQCDPNLSFLFNVSNMTATTVKKPGTR